MRRINEFMKRLQFSFSEVDASLNGWEMLAVAGIGLLIIAFVFVGGV